MIKKIVFSAAIVLISLFLCSAGCGNVAVSSPAPSIVINFSDDFFGWGDSSGGSQQDNSGGGGTFAVPESEALVISSLIQNSSNDKIYVFVRVKGISRNNALFKPKNVRTNTGSIESAIPRAIHFEPTADISSYKTVVIPTVVTYLNNKFPGKNINYSTLGLTPQYGIANSSGTEINAKFYVGADTMSVQKTNSNKVTFRLNNFTVIDDSIDGEFMGKPVFVRCAPVNFEIPMEKFDSTIHQNYAMFTASFEIDSAPHKATVTFDGFLPKNYSGTIYN